jgi:hypothetical protein
MSRSHTALVVATLACQPFALHAQAKKPRAVQADIETTYVLADGRQFTSHGQYFRGRDGELVREDSRLGAMIMDARKGTITTLNYGRKEARVITAAAPPASRSVTTPNPVPFEHAIVDGHHVTKTRTTSPQGDVHEYWTDTDLGLVVLSRVESPGLTTTKLLRNIVVREPGAATFSVPKGFTIVKELPTPDTRGAVPR